MDPISMTVASIITGFLARAAGAVSETVGAAVTDAAKTITQTVLEKLKSTPGGEPTVEKYQGDPEKLEPAIAVAIDNLVAADAAFRTELDELLKGYEAAKEGAGGLGVEIHGSEGGSVQSCDRNLQFDRTNGDVRIDRDAGED